MRITEKKKLTVKLHDLDYGDPFVIEASVSSPPGFYMKVYPPSGVELPIGVEPPRWAVDLMTGSLRKFHPTTEVVDMRDRISLLLEHH